MPDILLSETLSGDWVVTTPSPFEDGWETELARINASATADGSDAEKAAYRAASYAAITFAMGRGTLRVQSHDAFNRRRMVNLIHVYGPEAGVKAEEA